MASPLNVLTRVGPVLDVPLATFDYVEFGGTGDLSAFGADAISFDFPTNGDLFVDLLITFDTSSPLGTMDAALFSADDSGSFLDGVLVNAGFTTDLIQLLFGGLTGSAAAAFGPTVLVEVFFIDPLGANPFAGLVDGRRYDTALTTTAAVPLPAALPALAAGLGALVLVRRRRGRS
jgi:hypothetical protein